MPEARAPAAGTSWERAAAWYDGWVGERGSRYHQQIVIPAVLELLEARKGERILDVGAGQGVLAPYIEELGATYVGVDASPNLIARARRRHGQPERFVVGDARVLRGVPGIEQAGYDAAVFLLSIQDMDPLEPVFASVSWALPPSGRVVLAMTHPCFRQPRQSGWGFDESRGLQFRRVDAYLSEMAVPMKAFEGRLATRSFHRPISAYVNGLAAEGFAIDAMRELPDLPPESRPRRASAGTRAEAEFPLFLMIRARRG